MEGLLSTTMRHDLVPNDLIFLSASFKGFRKKLDLVKKEMIKLKEKKEKAQPTKIKTSGSTFKNPLGQSDKKVWQLIKESVPLEKSFGDAGISKKHCNFFVNKGLVPTLGHVALYDTLAPQLMTALPALAAAPALPAALALFLSVALILVLLLYIGAALRLALQRRSKV